MPQPPRYCPELPLPPYTYVPGGPWPHPTSDPRGHSFGRQEPPPAPLADENYLSSPAYLHVDLFNHGFYWEAHEAWESLWHAAGRRGPTADFLKGLIKLAAAGVKAREGLAAGVRQHALRAAELLGSAAAAQPLTFGLPTADLTSAAQAIALRAAELAGDGRPNASRRLPLILTPQSHGSA